jgi:DNA-binding transcriptional MerR regulator
MQTKSQIVSKKGSELPPIPDKVYFTIGEVSGLCVVKAHVIRYWETEFKPLKPVRRRNRRYYQRKDILLIRQISHLLYEEGYTIEGARQQLQRSSTSVEASKESPKKPIKPQAAIVAEFVMDLKRVLEDLES